MRSSLIFPLPMLVALVGCAHPKPVKPVGEIISPTCIKVVCKGDWVMDNGGVKCTGVLKAQLFCAVPHE